MGSLVLKGSLGFSPAYLKTVRTCLKPAKMGSMGLQWTPATTMTFLGVVWDPKVCVLKSLSMEKKVKLRLC